MLIDFPPFLPIFDYILNILVISVEELTINSIKEKVKDSVPEAISVVMDKDSNRGNPIYRAKVYNQSNEIIHYIVFEYKKSDFFYNGQKIYL